MAVRPDEVIDKPPPLALVTAGQPVPAGPDAPFDHRLTAKQAEQVSRATALLPGHKLENRDMLSGLALAQPEQFVTLSASLDKAAQRKNNLAPDGTLVALPLDAMLALRHAREGQAAAMAAGAAAPGSAFHPSKPDGAGGAGNGSGVGADGAHSDPMAKSVPNNQETQQKASSIVTSASSKHGNGPGVHIALKGADGSLVEIEEDAPMTTKANGSAFSKADFKGGGGMGGMKVAMAAMTPPQPSLRPETPAPVGVIGDPIARAPVAGIRGYGMG